MGRRPWQCRECKSPAGPDNPISKRGLCGPCGVAAYEQSQRDLRAGSGPTAEAWREGLARAVERARQR